MALSHFSLQMIKRTQPPNALSKGRAIAPSNSSPTTPPTRPTCYPISQFRCIETPIHFVCLLCAFHRHLTGDGDDQSLDVQTSRQRNWSRNYGQIAHKTSDFAEARSRNDKILQQVEPRSISQAGKRHNQSNGTTSTTRRSYGRNGRIQARV